MTHTLATPDLTRDGEPFTAVTDCPKCGVMAVHWLEEPRVAPAADDDSPMVRMVRMWDQLATHFVFGDGRGFFDPPNCVVARVCTACEYRWGQR